MVVKYEYSIVNLILVSDGSGAREASTTTYFKHSDWASWQSGVPNVIDFYLFKGQSYGHPFLDIFEKI